MNRKAWVTAAALLSAGMAQATCYSVYKADGTLIQESSTTPVNLALQIGDTVPEKFGSGATMTISDHGVYCKDRRETQGAPKSLAEAVRAEGEKAQQVAGAKEAAAVKTESASAR
jgi:hypothetical protein